MSPFKTNVCRRSQAKSCEDAQYDDVDAREAEEDALIQQFNDFSLRSHAQECTFKVKHSRTALISNEKSTARDTLVAFCHGSALDNGTSYCKAAFAVVFPQHEEWNIARELPPTTKATNNRAVYVAALEAMKRANFENPSQDHVLHIYTNSTLLIRSMREWLPKWMKNNWIKADGKPVKNVDLLVQMHEAQGIRCILWEHVQANSSKSNWQAAWYNKAVKLSRSTALNDEHLISFLH